MKSRQLLLVTTFLLFSLSDCNKKAAEQRKITEQSETHSCGCGTKNPLNDLAWIKKVLSDSYYFSTGVQLTVYSGAKFYCCNYNGENVFYLDNPASNLGIGNKVVFDCQSNVLLAGYEAVQDFLKNKTNEQLLWSK